MNIINMDIINMTPHKFSMINKQCSEYCNELYNHVKLQTIKTDIELTMYPNKLSFKAIVPNADIGIIVSIPYDINEFCHQYGFKIETNICNVNGDIIYTPEYPESYNWVGIDEIMNEILYVCE
jgi:hypothetical protein